MDSRVMRNIRLATAVVPAVCVAFVFLGWRTGQTTPPLVARVYAFPQGGNHAQTFQVHLEREISGFSEPAREIPLTALLHFKERTSRLEAVTNQDGVAELAFEFLDASDRAELDLTLYDDSGTALVDGPLPTWSRLPPPRRSELPFVPAAEQSGPIVIEPIVFGDALAPTFTAPLWAHLSGPGPIANVTVTLEGEELQVDQAAARSCGNGWIHWSATATGHAPIATLRAHAPDGAAGLWRGPLPVTPGAPDVTSFESVRPDEARRIEVTSANERDLLYLEVLDERGRAFGRSLRLDRDGGFLRTGLDLPPLSQGIHWLIVSTEVSGDGSYAAATTRRAFFVRDREPICSVVPELFAHAPPAPERKLALDGSLRAREAMARRRALGRTVAAAALVLGGGAELALIALALRGAQNPALAGALVRARMVALLFGALAILGFLLLAILVLAR